MKIAIASGKGGTGKTLVSVSMAMSLAQQQQVTLLDCDVEEPNAHIFLDNSEKDSIEAKVSAFEVDDDKCNACGKCARACRFNAVASLKTVPMFFPELCHGCGGCLHACPTGAIYETERTIGCIDKSVYNLRDGGKLKFISGKLNVGEAMATPLIRLVRKQVVTETVIIDAPPGASCAMLAAIDNCDYVILVTEPTPFGLSDLKKAVAAVKEKHIPFGVIINRFEEDIPLIDAYCKPEGISVLLRIPFSIKVARDYSRGKTLLHSMPKMWHEFTALHERISKSCLVNL